MLFVGSLSANIDEFVGEKVIARGVLMSDEVSVSINVSNSNGPVIEQYSPVLRDVTIVSDIEGM